MSAPAVKESRGVGRVAIFGPGIIGGSIAMALRSRSPGTMISAWARNEEELKELYRRGLADAIFTNPADAVENADLVVLCTPVGSMEELAREMASGLASTTLITDAGSVKACVVDQLTPILGGNYVGGHPMAGSERSGLRAARGDLFSGAPCLITPTPESNPSAIAIVKRFWEILGCMVTIMSPVEHDRVVARLSHLPHALAYALMNLVIDTLPEGTEHLAGGSFRDATRVAASSPALWTGILTSNAPEVAAALREMSKLLKSMAAAIGDENPDTLLDFLKRAKHHRDLLPFPAPGGRVHILNFPMQTFTVHHCGPIRATITVPGDKSMSHRSAMFASLAEGKSTITGFLEAEDCLSTVSAMRSLGAHIERTGTGTFVVEGTGGKFTAPATNVDCGNSGTTMRLLSGILASQPFSSRLTGDASLSKRPMGRVIKPLTEMGARFVSEGGDGKPPLVVEGGRLIPLHYEMPVASAQVKSAILLAGLSAVGETSVVEPAACRDHTERMLQEFGVTLDLGTPDSNGRRRIALTGPQALKARDFTVPGDISSAAFWLVAASAKQGSDVTMPGVGLNPTRTGVISVLQRMGAIITVDPVNPKAAEPLGTLRVVGGELHGTVIEGAEIPNVIDELPILAVAGALAQGTTIIRDAKELRVKETDRIAAVAGNLRAMGAHVTETEDGMVIEGGHPLHGASLQCFHDHRIAMAFAIAGLFAEGETVIEKVECVATSYPTFGSTLQSVLTA